MERTKIKEVEQHFNEIETRMEEIQNLKGKIECLYFCPDSGSGGLGFDFRPLFVFDSPGPHLYLAATLINF